ADHRRPVRGAQGGGRRLLRRGGRRPDTAPWTETTTIAPRADAHRAVAEQGPAGRGDLDVREPDAVERPAGHWASATRLDASLALPAVVGCVCAGDAGAA